MILQNSICTCNNFVGCSCGFEENQFFSYTGGGTFPMRKGSRGEHVKALQVALNTKFNTPASLRIITPTDFWGDKTQALIDYHGLPTEIPNAQVLQAILEGKKPTQTNTQTSTSTSTWKDALKDPNKALGLLGQVSQIFSGFRSQNQNLQPKRNFELQLGHQYLENQNLNQNSKRLPTAAWITIGLVALLFIGLLIYKIAR